MEMRLPSRLGISYPLLQYLLGFFHVLSMEVNRVARDSAFGVVLSEYEIGGLLVVLIHHLSVTLALFRQRMGCRAVTALIRLTRLLLLIGIMTDFGPHAENTPWRQMTAVFHVLHAQGPGVDHTQSRRRCSVYG